MSRRTPRPTEFLLPSGKRVLVALPADIDAVRTKYARSHDADPPTQVEVVVHGSEEHRRLLHQSKTHHEKRHAYLREKVGHDVADEIVAARKQLEIVSRQLERLERENGLEEGLGLGKNFEKFGFDAKVRTYGGDGGHGSGSEDLEGGSRRTSLASTGRESSLWEGGMSGYGEALRLSRKPVVKQYFHRGLLW